MIVPTHFFNEKLTIDQYRDGYRFSLDAPILADFVSCDTDDVLVEIGTGCGIIPLILAQRKQFQQVIAIEIQSALADLARRNVKQNRLLERIQVVEGDARFCDLSHVRGRVDVVFSNPPYRRLGSGRLNPLMEKAIARHELCLVPDDIWALAGQLLTPYGVICLIHRWDRMEELVDSASKHQFYLTRFRKVFSKVGDQEPKRVLVSLGRGSVTVTTDPSLYIHEHNGSYTRAFQIIIGAG